MRHPISIEAFAEWCERKPADEEYEWVNVRTCAIKQYAKFLGGNVHENYMAVACMPVGRFDGEYMALMRPHTFGALAARLRNANPEQG